VLAKLLLLFTIIPIVELAILIPLGQWMGLVPTVALVVVTGVLGAVLAKRQGLAAWNRLHGDLGEGRLPGDSLLDGLAVLIAGAFLVTPGVLTDIAGMVLLIPPLRKPLKHYLKKRFKRSLESGSVTYINFEGPFAQNPFDQASPFDQSSAYDDGEVIDVTPDESETHESDRRRMN
jgi:UPF0716 protein FxsA